MVKQDRHGVYLISIGGFLVMSELLIRGLPDYEQKDRIFSAGVKGLSRGQSSFAHGNEFLYVIHCDAV